MRTRGFIWLTLTLLLIPTLHAARAQEANDAIYVVSYIDVSVPAATRVTDLLQQMAQSGRQAL